MKIYWWPHWWREVVARAEPDGTITFITQDGTEAVYGQWTEDYADKMVATSELHSIEINNEHHQDS